METNELQQQLFGYLKSALPPHLSMADEIGHLLNLSPDSVYRRIRGEKPITLNELKKICDNYHLSLDQLLQLQTDTVVFNATDLNKKQFPFREILENMLRQLMYFNSFKHKRIFYLCKDMPIWQFYLSRELAAFKTFFWAKTIHNEPAYLNKQFELDEFEFEDCFKMGQDIIRQYNDVPGIELWNLESINSTLSQIRYYIESGNFKNEGDIERVIQSFESTLKHLQLQAEKGQKFMPGDTDLSYRATHELYVNEVVIGSNTILAEVDDNKISFIPYNVFSFIHTRDKRFNESVFNGFHTLKSRSTLISGTGEKERNKFFRYLFAKVNELRR